MSKVAIVYHSGFGHTQALAEAIAKGAKAVPGATVSLVPVAEAEARATELDAFLGRTWSGIIFPVPDLPVL